MRPADFTDFAFTLLQHTCIRLPYHSHGCRTKVSKVSGRRRTSPQRNARDAKIGEAHAFELRPIEIGKDEDGDPVTAVVAMAADAPMAHKASAPRKLSDGSKVALKVLRELLKAHGAGVAGPDAPPGTLAVRREQWRESHRDRYGGNSADADATGAERQAWKRALEQLQAASIITVHGEWVWANDRKLGA
jgi:hypothetical protein